MGSVSHAKLAQSTLVRGKYESETMINHREAVVRNAKSSQDDEARLK